MKGKTETTITTLTTMMALAMARLSMENRPVTTGAARHMDALLACLDIAIRYVLELPGP